MAELTGAIRAVMTTYEPLAAIVALRVYPDFLPQNPQFPCVSFNVITADNAADTLELNGSLLRASVQVDAWAEKKSVANSLGSLVRDALQAFTGESADVTIFAVAFERREEIYTPESKEHRVLNYFSVWYRADAERED